MNLLLIYSAFLFVCVLAAILIRDYGIAKRTAEVAAKEKEKVEALPPPVAPFKHNVAIKHPYRTNENVMKLAERIETELPVKDPETAGKIRMSLFDTFSAHENEWVQKRILPQHELDDMVSEVMKEIPKRLKEALCEKKDQFYIFDSSITHPSFTTAKVRDYRKKIFAEIVVPEVKTRLDAAGVKYLEIHVDCVAFDVKDLKSFCKFDKMKAMG